MYPSGPIFSIILTIFAGIALRYALWYGKDDDDGSELKELRERTRTLHDALESERADQHRLASDLKAMTADYESIRIALDQRESEFHQIQSEVGVLKERESEWSARESEWSAREAEWQNQQGDTGQLQEMVARLQSEERSLQNQNAALQDQLRTLEAQRDTLYGEIESTRADAANLSEERQQVSAALETSAQTRAGLEKQLKASLQQVDDLKDLLRRSEEKLVMLEADARFASELREEQSQLKTSLHASSERMRDVYAENEALADRARQWEQRAETAEEQVGTLQSTIRAQSRQLEEQTGQLAEYAEKLRVLGEQADAKIAEIREASQLDLDTLREEQTEAAKEVGARFEEEMEALRARQAEELQEARLLHDQEITQWRTREQALTNKLIELEKHIQGVRDATSSFESESSQLRSERDTMFAEMTELRADVKRLQSELEITTESLRLVSVEKDEVVHGLLREREQRSELEAASVEARRVVVDSAKSVEQLRRLRDDYDRLQHRFVDAKSELQRIDEENQELRQRSESHHKSTAERLDRLETERDFLRRELETERRERENSEQLVSVQAETLDRLRQDSASLEALLQRQTMIQSSLKKHTDRLHDATRESTHDERGKVISFRTERNADESLEGKLRSA